MTTSFLRGILIFSALSCITSLAHAQDALAEKLRAAAEQNRARLDYDGETLSGPAWDTLLSEGKAAQFFLIGEEHGIAENPKLAGQIFTALHGHGYDHLVIEVSPPMANALDGALAKDGLDGLRALFAQKGGEPAFFGMKEEAELLYTVRSAARGKAPVLWGADYEVAGDRVLLRQLAAMKKPKAARDALKALDDASLAAWAKYEETRGPQYIFSFSGDPALVRAVKDAWPNRPDTASVILDTLEETLEVNRHWVQGQGWQSNARRAALLRTNFLRYWRAEKTAGRTPKVMAKLGASHLVRGRNMTETFDLGALLPEIAALEGGKSFSMMVLPGAGSMTAVLDPSAWRFVHAPAKDSYAQGLDAVTGAAYPDAFTLIDLRPLRPIVSRSAPESLKRIIHGFDMLLVMSGSTPSGEFDHPAPQ